MMKCNLFRLLRIKHYIKNLLVFIPMIFGGVFFDIQKLIRAGGGFVSFCFVSSVVYILNDLRDIDRDRQHPIKKNRPLASGSIKKNTAIKVMVLCFALAVIISVYLKNVKAIICLALYFLLNIAYSMGLKNKPIVDIVILAFGFVVRVIYGGYITNVEVSKWLYLVVLTGSLYMGLCKRRNEFKVQANTRDVLKYYNVGFLDKNMYVCLALTNVFFALWTLEISNPMAIYTVPIFIILLMRYSWDVEGDSDGDPVEVILRDKVLLCIVFGYAMFMFALIYLI